MYTIDQLYSQIKKLGVQSTDTLLVHSSMKAIGEVENRADGVLDALIQSVSDGMLVLPTHTWATINEQQPVYCPKTEPACVGILPNLFMKREWVYRSLHPTHSVAAWSKDIHRVQRFLAGEETRRTPCSREGVYGKLYDENAKILLLGVGFNRNTYMHGVEEWFGIQERLTKDYLSLTIQTSDGIEIPVQMKKHFKPNGISISEYYGKMEPVFLENGIEKKGYVGDAHAILLSARGVADITTEYLKQNRDVFLDDRPL